MSGGDRRGSLAEGLDGKGPDAEKGRIAEVKVNNERPRELERTARSYGHKILASIKAAGRRFAAWARAILYEDAASGRLRKNAFVALAVALCFAASAVTVGIGSVALMRLDPLRVLASSLGLPNPRELSARNDAHALLAKTTDLRAQLLGLRARAGALQRPARELDALSTGNAKLAELEMRQRALLQAPKLSQANIAELKDLSAQADALAASSIRTFSQALAAGLAAQAQQDMQRARDFDADSWGLDTPPLLAALSAARDPLATLEAGTKRPADAAEAIALAQKILDVGVGLAGVRLPLLQADRARAARREFTEIEAQIHAMLEGLRDEADNRPWFFAGEQRRDAYRTARERWDSLQPLLSDLAVAHNLAFGSRDPATIETALLRAHSIRLSVQQTLDASGPPAAEPTEPPQATDPNLTETLERAGEAAAAAQTRYRRTAAAAEAVLNEDYRRRRERRIADALRSKLDEMQELVERVTELQERVSQAKNSGDAQRTAQDIARLDQRLEGSEEEARRLIEALR